MFPFLRATTLVGLLICTGGFASPLYADPNSWSQFRGANSAGVAEDGPPLPVEFAPQKHCLWSTPLPIGHSSPCIWGDRIFLTSHDPANNRLETLCLNRGTGEIMWRKSAPAEMIERGYELGNPAASTATADAERVYVYFGSYGLLCYDHSGAEQWKLPLPLPKTRFGTAASPVLAADRLLLNYQGEGAYLLAVNPKTGGQIWKNDKLPYAPDYALPLIRQVGDVTEAIVQGTGGMAAVDMTDGKVRWQVAGFAFQPIPTPVVGDGLVFVVSFHPIGKSEDRINLKFDDLLAKYDENGDKKLAQTEVPEKLALVSRGATDGTGDMTFKQMWFMLDTNKDKLIDAQEWLLADLFTRQINNALLAFRPDADGKISQKGMVWKAEKGLPESPSPLFYKGRLYTVKNGGIMSCYDAAAGKLHFQKRIGADGSYYASPIAGDGKIYASSMNGVVTVIAAADDLEILASNDLGEPVMATPAIVEGKLYIRTATRLHAFGE
jgi:outer membrane protein assembly factor BamB